jgi:beta-lactamase class A
VKGAHRRLKGLIGRFWGEYLLIAPAVVLISSCIPQVEDAIVDTASAAQPTRVVRSASQAPVRRPVQTAPVRRSVQNEPIRRAPVRPSNAYAGQSSAPAYSYPAPAYAYPAPRQAVPAQLATAQRSLEARVHEIGQNFQGDVGIAVRDVQTGWTTHYDGATYFPQQSVSKFWVALTALQKADRGEIDLNKPVVVRKSDLTLFHQPIASLVSGGGYHTTIGDLIYRAITQSDNTANDFVLWRAGGPNAVRNFLASNSIAGIRFGPGERVMQAKIAGMEWKSSMVGQGFYRARAALPMSTRRNAFEQYIDDPIDGATPLGIVNALARLQRGELLSPEMTRRMLTTMSNTRTGRQRLKGGLAPGWKLAHKTGTGQVLNSTQAGYNDIGIVTAPDGRDYAVAVMIRRTSAPIPQRMAMMQNVVRAVIGYHHQARGLNVARGAPAYTPAVYSNQGRN